MSRPKIFKKHRRTTITNARNLYVIALQCRHEALGEPITDAEFEERPTTQQKTWFLLAERLMKKGWRPPARPPEMPPRKAL